MDKPSVSPAIQSSIDRLKSTGERITLNFDNCEFKGRENMREPEESERALGYVAIGAYYAMLDEQLAAQPRDSSQSALVYLHKTGDRSERFQSPVYPISDISLQAHVLKGDLKLFVDRYDRKNFYFELTAS